MKNYIIILATLMFTLSQAQIAIGKATVDGTNTILDFGSDDNKGIILPWVLDEATVTETSSFYFDTETSKVMFVLASGDHQDLSVKGTQTAFDETRYGYNTYEENPNVVNGTVFGATTSTKEGALVLEQSVNPQVAMILPKVTAYSNVGDPEPGTIVYDSTAKMLCVFDGEQWAFWGEE